MPAESKAKVIERNRAPRVQIAYDVETYGSPTTIELPFVMGVMADLAGAQRVERVRAHRTFLASRSSIVSRRTASRASPCARHAAIEPREVRAS